MTQTDSVVSTPIGAPNAKVASLFSDVVSAVDAEPRLVCERLYSEERHYIRSAVATRKAEFGTARVIAREALDGLGVKAQPLTPRANRAPSWPEGVQGSISHTAGYCVVVVSNTLSILTLGVDVERKRILQPDVMSLICTARELSWLNSVVLEHRDTLSMVLFSAKEATYKCQYPVTQRFLDFTDLDLAIDFDSGEFVPIEVRGLSAADASKVEAIRGRFLVTERFVFTGATLMRDPG